jgi:hypothetical protein
VTPVLPPENRSRLASAMPTIPTLRELLTFKEMSVKRQFPDPVTWPSILQFIQVFLNIMQGAFRTCLVLPPQGK